MALRARFHTQTSESPSPFARLRSSASAAPRCSSQRARSVLTLAASLLFTTTLLHAETAALRFRINSVHSGSNHRIFRYDGDTLSVVDGTTVDISVNQEMFSRVQFTLAATNQGASISSQFDGTFSFTTSQGELLLSGRFDDAFLLARTGRFGREGAVFFRRDDHGDSTVQLTVGPALASIPGCIAPQNFRFHLWGLRYESENQSDGEEQVVSTFPRFTAKGSFIGSTDVVPEPSAVFLVVMCLLGTRSE